MCLRADSAIEMMAIGEGLFSLTDNFMNLRDLQLTIPIVTYS
jgi:hypothetical protein